MSKKYIKIGLLVTAAAGGIGFAASRNSCGGKQVGKVEYREDEDRRVGVAKETSIPNKYHLMIKEDNLSGYNLFGYNLLGLSPTINRGDYGVANINTGIKYLFSVDVPEAGRIIEFDFRRRSENGESLENIVRARRVGNKLEIRAPDSLPQGLKDDVHAIMGGKSTNNFYFEKEGTYFGVVVLGNADGSIEREFYELRVTKPKDKGFGLNDEDISIARKMGLLLPETSKIIEPPKIIEKDVGSNLNNLNNDAGLKPTVHDAGVTEPEEEVIFTFERKK